MADPSDILASTTPLHAVSQPTGTLTSLVVPSLSIYLTQKGNLLSMIQSCKITTDPFEENEDVWKILIYDKQTRDVVAPILSVSELRKVGVTLHLQIDSKRYAVPDVPAIYFVNPTEENVAHILNDITSQKYTTYWINFAQTCSRSVLESFANQLATHSQKFISNLNTNDQQQHANGNSYLAAQQQNILPYNRIGRVWDMYNMFHSLQHNLFSLNIKDTYAKLNAINISNSSVESIIQQVVERLFYVCITLKAVPIIKAQTGGPANLVATMLDEKIREHLKLNNSTFNEDNSTVAGLSSSNSNSNNSRTSSFHASSTRRPVLIIVDRSIDLSIMLHHSWTYQALTHDILDLHLNRVSIPIKDPNAPAENADDPSVRNTPVKKKSFDVDISDTFWMEHSGLPFPMVAEAVEASLQSYRQKAAELTKSSDINNSNYLDEEDDKDAANKLAKAISNIPELTKHKKMIDLHTNIATALLDEIKGRGLDGYYQIEEELLDKGSMMSYNVEKILAILNHNHGNYNDKLRLFLIYYLTCINNISDGEIKKCLDILYKFNNNQSIKAFNYLKNIQKFNKSMSNTNIKNSGSNYDLSSSNHNNGQSNNDNNLNFFNAASVLDTLSQVASNMNKLIISTDSTSPLAKHVKVLMDSSAKKDHADQNIAEQYVTLDPKSPKYAAPSVSATAKAHFEQAIVFIVGPGNYIEFQSCQDYVCSKVVQDSEGKSHMMSNGKTVIYGATELCTGEQFLEQLHANGIDEQAENANSAMTATQ